MAGQMMRAGPTASLLEDRPAAADPLSAELLRWAREDALNVEGICGLSVLAWVERATGRELAPRPPKTRMAIARELREAGGFEALCARTMAELGCAETAEPRRGDVGLVTLPGSGLTACICAGTSAAGTMWAARAVRGVVMEPGHAVRAWRVDAGGSACPTR